MALNYGLLEKILRGSSSAKHGADGWEKQLRNRQRGQQLGRPIVLQILWAIRQAAPIPEVAKAFGIGRLAVHRIRFRFYKDPSLVRHLSPYFEMYDADSQKTAYRCIVCGSLKPSKLLVELHCVRELIPEAYLALHWPFTPEETEILGGM